MWSAAGTGVEAEAGRGTQGKRVADHKTEAADGPPHGRSGVEGDLAAIVEGIAAGERAALKQLYDRFGGRLYGVAHRILRNSMLAEDAIQEAFVKIWRNAGKYERARGSALGWVVTIVRRAAFDLRPRESVGEPVDIADEQPEPGMLDPGLARALDALPEQQCRALLLMYVHGLTHAELATEMGVPLGTAKSWVRRAAAALRKAVGDR